ncbi:glycosyltransferase [Mycobacterium sp. ML4]
MRIAIVWGDDACSGDFAGNAVGQELGEFCAALAGHGHTVTAHPRQQAEQPAEQIQPPYLTVPARVGPPAPVSPARVLPFVGEWAAELTRCWSTEPPDIVHSFGWLGGLAAQLAARRFQLLTVQSFHGLAVTDARSGAVQPNDFERARLEPLLIRGATWVTGGSSEELEVLTRLRRNRARTSVLATGIDAERYTCTDPAWTDHGTHRILQVAPNLQPRNGLDRTIRVLPHVPDSELIIAETSVTDAQNKKRRTQLKRMATELGVSDRVRFANYVAPEDIPTLLWSADVVACTPRLAPRATSALQAMASGRAVVGTAVGALMDTVIGNVTGVLVSPTKPYQLAGALKTMQQQRFQRQSMGSAGRSRVMSRFTWDRIAQDALSIYEQTSNLKTGALGALGENRTTNK